MNLDAEPIGIGSRRCNVACAAELCPRGNSFCPAPLTGAQGCSHMPSVTSSYLFALTNPGAERALKTEAAGKCPLWRPSYQQRGFVTFKSGAAPFWISAADTPLAFARRICLSLGRSPDRDAALALLKDIPDPVIHEIQLEHGRQTTGADSPALPVAGQIVATVVQAGPGEFWTGVHLHGPAHSPDPGGAGGLTMPEDSPSRAWLKLEESARFFGLKFSPADVVVELGCAPGGVVLALLRRGVSVIGVDPAKLAPVVMTNAVEAVPGQTGGAPWVFHCRKPAALVSRRDLAGRATWFMSDMNQSPEVALKECRRFTGMCPSIRSALITLKLTDLAEAGRAPEWHAALREMGFRQTRLQQLSVHHRELALLGLDRK